MKTAHPKRAGSFALSLLLLLPALPASAETAPPAEPRVDLDLEASLADPEPMLRLLTDHSAGELGLRLAGAPFGQAGAATAAELDLAALRAEAWEAAQVAQAGGSGKAPKRGFGRWLKKHWWVPVLVVAAGVAAGSGGDTDAGGEED